MRDIFASQFIDFAEQFLCGNKNRPVSNPPCDGQTSQCKRRNRCQYPRQFDLRRHDDCALSDVSHCIDALPRLTLGHCCGGINLRDTLGADNLNSLIFCLLQSRDKTLIANPLTNTMSLVRVRREDDAVSIGNGEFYT